MTPYLSIFSILLLFHKKKRATKAFTNCQKDSLDA